jgi:hypothetical protein
MREEEEDTTRGRVTAMTVAEAGVALDLGLGQVVTVLLTATDLMSEKEC